MKTLVLGLGNLLLCDEGVGVHVARALMESGCPDGTIILDVGTAILDALPAIETAERIIVVDAVITEGGVPGSVYRMPLGSFVNSSCIASMHGFDLSRVLMLAGRTDLPEVTVIGIEPALIDWSMELSAQVAEALPEVLEIVREEMMR